MFLEMTSVSDVDDECEWRFYVKHEKYFKKKISAICCSPRCDTDVVVAARRQNREKDRERERKTEREKSGTIINKDEKDVKDVKDMKDGLRSKLSTPWVIIGDKFGDVMFVDCDSMKTKRDLGHLSIVTDLCMDAQLKYVVSADKEARCRISRFPNLFIIEAFCFGHTQLESICLLYTVFFI